MGEITQWVMDNKEWLFSGVGLVVVSWLASKSYRKKQEAGNTIQQSSNGNQAPNINTSGDVDIKYGSTDD